MGDGAGHAQAVRYAADGLRGPAGRVCWPPVKIITMKTIILFIALLVLASGLAAASVTIATKAQFKGQKGLSWPDGKVLMAPDEIVFPPCIVVRTNGTYTVQSGKERQLQEGEQLGADGMLTRPDGSISLVIDHVTLSRGRVVGFKDGAAADVREPLKLGVGAIVSPDGKITLPGS